jgi:hypothetical protein
MIIYTHNVPEEITVDNVSKEAISPGDVRMESSIFCLPGDANRSGFAGVLNGDVMAQSNVFHHS